MKRTGWLVVGGIVLILFFWGCSQQRGLATADLNVQNKWSDVETNYQRRMDLYSSVIKTIEGSANFEKSTLKEVVDARARATSVRVDVNDSTSLQQFQQAQAQLQGSFSRLIAVAENYPDLKGTKNFLYLQSQLEGTERRIKVARNDFNAAVADYNKKVRSFPSNIFAGIFGFKKKEGFEAAAGSDKAVEIKF